MRFRSELKRRIKRLVWSSSSIESDGSEILWRPRRLINTASRMTAGTNLFVGRDSVFNLITEYRGVELNPKVTIGDNCYIGHHFSLHCASQIDIGPDAVFSDHVYISDNAHGMVPHAGNIMKQALELRGDVKIGANCFIGYGSSVLPGVSLGPWTIVGTRSVVTKSYDGYVMLAGAPAHPIKAWDESKGQWLPLPSRSEEDR